MFVLCERGYQRRRTQLQQRDASARGNEIYVHIICFNRSNDEPQWCIHIPSTFCLFLSLSIAMLVSSFTIGSAMGKRRVGDVRPESRHKHQPGERARPG